MSQVEMLMQQSGHGELSPEEGFYPKPMEDYGELGRKYPQAHHSVRVQMSYIADYPWAGSLKPVSNEFVQRRKGRSGDIIDINPTQLSKEWGTTGKRRFFAGFEVAGDPGPCPWAGSLRPVGEASARRRTKKNEGWGGTSLGF